MDKQLTLQAGTKLRCYEIRQNIGEGGMGEVYLAQDTKLDREVALKVLPAEVASPPSMVTFQKDTVVYRHVWSPDGKALALARGHVVTDVVLRRDER